MRKNISIYTQYIRLLVIIPLLVIALSLIIGITNYYLLKKDREFILLSSAIKIHSYLIDNFEYILHFSQIVGDKISSEDAEDSEIIGKIFQKAYSIAQIGQNVASITNFEFLNPAGKVVANMIEGAIQNPAKTNHYERSWLALTPVEPWNLHISPYPVKENNGKDIITLGFGIVGKSGQFLGTISAGIDIDKLVKKLAHELNNESVEFMIVTNDFKFVSESNYKIPQIYDLQKLQSILTTSQNHLLKEKITINDIEYSVFQYIENYPFIIIVGEKEYFARQDFQRGIVLPVIFSLTISMLLFLSFLFFRNKLVIPITELSNVAKSISSGNLDVKVPEYNAEETANLATELSKIKNYTFKINEMRHDLEQALSAKIEFLNNISHEIRTPILGFTNISEALIEHWQDFDDSKKLSLATEIAKNSRRMRSFVGNLLDMAKFNSGNLLLEMHKFDLTKIVNSIIDECKTLYMLDKNIEITFNNQMPNEVFADEERIAQVLRNLFLNAIKFSYHNKKIEVKLSTTEITYNTGEKIHGVHFSITDEGVGIPEDEINLIFTPFSQSSRTKTKAGGSGLGLAIALEIIEAHNGKIWAENNENGKGATLNFIIPATELKQTENYKIFAQQLVTTTNQSANILIIDDEDVCLLSMDLLLRGTNYNLIKANSAHLGLEYLYSNPHQIDLILLDLMMQDMYGLAVIAKIKKNDVLSKIPIILQSGTSDQNEVEKAYKMGIVRYIKKPYQKHLVLMEIAKALNSREI